MIFGKHINRYYLKYLGWLLLGIVSLFAVDYCQMVIPKLYRIIINGLNTGMVEIDGVMTAFGMDILLDEVCFHLLVVILTLVVGRFLWRICFFGVAIKVEQGLRDRMFDRARHLSREYYQVNKVGDLMSLFTNDLDTVQECVGWGIMMLFDAALMAVLAISNMWRMDHLLTVLALIPMGALMAASTLLGKHLTKKWDERQEAFSKLSDFAQESFSGIAVIKAFVKEAKELMAFKKLNVENEDANITFTRAAVLMRVLVTFFVETVICIILGYGGWLVYNKTFDAGQLIEFLSYFSSVVWPIMAVAELIDMTSRGKASLIRVSELLDAEVNVKDREDVQPLTEMKGDIEFRNLTFRYPDADYNALEDVSFTIHAGENIGLVGKTGAGKTTLVDLLLRTYNVPDGTIFVDGRDVNSVPIHDIRAGCAYVPQDNFLFSDTIAANIAFASDTDERDAVINAAKLADVDSNISEFQLGYETILGERGVTVSGGQKQRISIARALMKEAPILILDDSVSAVDTKTETTILQNLRETRAGKTTILIAHRISTIEKMDRILFIEEGRLSGMDTHDNLYANNDAYRKMVDLQKLEEEGM